eukprot:5083835-Amphidinium_carterae.1
MMCPRLKSMISFGTSRLAARSKFPVSWAALERVASLKCKDVHHGCPPQHHDVPRQATSRAGKAAVPGTPEILPLLLVAPSAWSQGHVMHRAPESARMQSS